MHIAYVLDLGRRENHAFEETLKNGMDSFFNILLGRITASNEQRHLWAGLAGNQYASTVSCAGRRNEGDGDSQ